MTRRALAATARVRALPHYVSPAPFDPYAVEAADAGAGALLHAPRSGG